MDLLSWSWSRSRSSLFFSGPCSRQKGRLHNTASAEKVFFKLIYFFSDFAVPLTYDDYSAAANPQLSPLVISHGMLGSRFKSTNNCTTVYCTTVGRVRKKSLFSMILQKITSKNQKTNNSFSFFKMVLGIPTIFLKAVCLNFNILVSTFFTEKNRDPWVGQMTHIRPDPDPQPLQS